jgi:hypothetical protein
MRKPGSAVFCHATLKPNYRDRSNRSAALRLRPVAMPHGQKSVIDADYS